MLTIGDPEVTNTDFNYLWSMITFPTKPWLHYKSHRFSYIRRDTKPLVVCAKSPHDIPRYAVCLPCACVCKETSSEFIATLNGVTLESVDLAHRVLEDQLLRLFDSLENPFPEEPEVSLIHRQGTGPIL